MLTITSAIFFSFIAHSGVFVRETTKLIHVPLGKNIINKLVLIIELAVPVTIKKENEVY